MKRISLPVKVGALMTLAVALISAAGYLTFQNLSSIVASIGVKSRPDLRLLTIRDITADLDKAENSVRLFRLTQKQEDIKPYYTVIAGIDDKIDSLRTASENDSILFAQIDTISSLIEENMMVWNKMLDLYHTDSLDIHIRQVTAKIAVGTLSSKKSERSIIKRVFSRKALKNEAKALEDSIQRSIISDLNRIGQRDSVKNTLLMETESKLALTGDEIRKRLYMLISRMENDVINSIHRNSIAANYLASQTYKWLGLFAGMVTLLVILVLLVVVRYVRKTKEYQRALERSKNETEKLAKTKEVFMANMSHELRTPVNAIYGFSEQLMHEPLSARSRKMLEVIKSTSDHLIRIVNDILDFSRLQNSKIELDKTDFLLRPIFEELKALFVKNNAKKSVKLFYTITEDTPEVLLGDPYRLKQILLNLIGNSVKFTSHGEISFSAQVEGDIIDNNFNLKLTVRDTGIGISNEMQTKVFEDFIQAEAGTSRKYGGSGLGLSIVKKLVELHKGTLSLESEEGKGTAITCILPYTIGKRDLLPLSAETKTIPDYIRNFKVLIVDDEEYNRMLFKTILERWNLDFDEAEDGYKALELVKSSKYNLVFLDARMPGMDGMEVARYVRNNMGLNMQALPIIGTSATHTIEDIRMYLSDGMNAFLPKPFTEKMLLEIILSLHQPFEIKNERMDMERLPEAVTERLLEKEVTIDLTNLYHLANNDTTFVKQLLNTFIESTEQGLSELQDAVKLKKIPEIREIAHKISSPCRHLGADNLYSFLKSLEEGARNNKNISILTTLSMQSYKEFNEIKTMLQKHLENIDV